MKRTGRSAYGRALDGGPWWYEDGIGGDMSMPYEVGLYPSAFEVVVDYFFAAEQLWAKQEGLA